MGVWSLILMLFFGDLIMYPVISVQKMYPAIVSITNQKDKLAKPELEAWFQTVNLNKENGKTIVSNNVLL
jgi:hypothetical protein